MIVVAALVAALIAAVMMLRDLDVAYVAVIGVVALLPFGSLPFKIGFTPTFLDLALIGLFGIWVLTMMLAEDQPLVTTPVGGPVLAFALLAVVAFVAGLSHGALTSYLIRHFVEILLSIALSGCEYGSRHGPAWASCPLAHSGCFSGCCDRDCALPAT